MEREYRLDFRNPKCGRPNLDEEFAKVMEDYMNGGYYLKKNFIKYMTHKAHRYLQAEFFNFCYDCIKGFAEVEDVNTDGRNENAVKCAREIVKCFETHGFKNN
jgi:hypothetical protein